MYNDWPSNPRRGEPAQDKQAAADRRAAEALLAVDGVEPDGRVVVHFVDGAQEVFPFREFEYWRTTDQAVEFHYFLNGSMDHVEIIPWHRVERLYVKGNSEDWTTAIIAQINMVRSQRMSVQVKV